MMHTANNKIILVFLLLILSSFAKRKNNTKFDYFRFDLVWPNSFCNQGVKLCREPIPQEFKVHGLWPYKAARRHARIYTRFSFSKTEVTKWNFSHSLSTVWPTLLNGMDDVQLWMSEWNKKGVCTDISPENYFFSGLKFANKYDYLYHSLLKSGVVTPSPQPYDRESLRDEITKLVGSSPIITCNQYNNTTQFLSVCICITIKGVALDCPYRYHKCGEGKPVVLFPTKETVFLSRGQEDIKEIPSTFKRNKFDAS